MKKREEKRVEKWIVGIDEAGRGPLAGPVAVGVVLVNVAQYSKLQKIFQDFRDSKKLSEKAREACLQEMKMLQEDQTLHFCVSMSDASTIDQKGINAATRQAIHRGLVKLGIDAESSEILLDGGLRAPEKYQNQQAFIKGDEKELVIALASVAAKVTRDEKMKRMAKKYPEYAFEKHKGYGTVLHLESISQKGLCDIHRKTFIKY